MGWYNNFYKNVCFRASAWTCWSGVAGTDVFEAALRVRFVRFVLVRARELFGAVPLRWREVARFVRVYQYASYSGCVI